MTKAEGMHRASEAPSDQQARDATVATAALNFEPVEGLDPMPTREKWMAMWSAMYPTYGMSMLLLRMNSDEMVASMRGDVEPFMDMSNSMLDLTRMLKAAIEAMDAVQARMIVALSKVVVEQDAASVEAGKAVPA